MPDSFETSILNTSVSDRAAAKDSLGFEPYVKAIGEFLTNPQTKPPLTLSVEGEWGSGKSSFMKQLQQKIEEESQKKLKEKLAGIEKLIRRFLLKILYVLPQKLELDNLLLSFLWLLGIILPTRILLFIGDLILSLLFKGLKWLLPRFVRKPRTVWFNAWRHDKAEALWAAFALEFIRQISNIRGIADVFPVLCGHLRLFFCRIQWTVDALLDALKTIAQLLLGIAAIATILIFSFGQGADWVVKLSEKVENLNTAIQEISKSEKDAKTAKQNQADRSKQSIQGNKDRAQPTAEKKDATDNKTDNPFSLPVGVAGIGGSTLIVISLWKQLKKMVGDPKKELVQYLNSPNYQSQVAFVEKFHQDFKKIVDAYVGNDKKVYVFIDDLDRCELPKSAELMQALNLMITEDPSIIFILGMDREKIAAGLAVKYQELLPYLLSESNFNDEEIDTSRSFQKGLEYGYGFIEKFVQLPFLVPQPADTDLDYFLQTIATPPPARLSLIRRSWQASQKLIQEIPQWWRQIQQFISQLGKKPERDRPPETPINPTTATPPRQENKEEAKLKRRQRIKLQVTEDSTTIRRITSMVASTLDYNPRRLKQFINLFRLRTYIASDTGLFDEWINTADNIVVNQSLTLEQLGKFVAINLKWPLLLTDLEDNPNLLKYLEAFSLPQTANETEYDKTTRYWGSRQKLKELICYGLDGTNGNDYSLAAVEVEKLLQVSPKGGRRKDKTRSFTEELGSNVTLEMLAIPEGKFLMGSPANEPNRSDRESPQHEVTVRPFFMSQFPITQAQWREIASLPRVKRYLNPEPSYFQGDDNRPVEYVSWYDAEEFCVRLSRLTGRKYRLPSEAEWEYACRAGTTTPYYFGEEINENLANYGNKVEKTTPVGNYPPNAFGLYDMHGNVWELCADTWHENYEGAPTDGRVWTTGGDKDISSLRGGSWDSSPLSCRSAYRNLPFRGRVNVLNDVGFRVVSESGRTL